MDSEYLRQEIEEIITIISRGIGDTSSAGYGDSEEEIEEWKVEEPYEYACSRLVSLLQEITKEYEEKTHTFHHLWKRRRDDG